MTSAVNCLALSCKPRNPFLNTLSAPSTRSTLATFRSIIFSTSVCHNVFFEVCLSKINIQRPVRQPVICMAGRYAPNSRLRKKKSRRRGGDPEKKRKRKRKRTGKRKGRGETKKKKNVKVIRFVSSASTGFFYAKKRNTKNKEKIEIKKYDPLIRRHVKFSEVK